jgi:putative ABC transport system permease protein
MFVFRLLLRNAFRHRLRTALTIVGLVVAICAFGLLRTLIDAWYAGVEASSSTRLITRSAVSLTFPLPLAYAQRLKALQGVTTISWANWFGGVYISERNFFPQFAVDPSTYLALYPEYVLKEDEKIAFLRDRRGAIVGRKLANQYGWKVGDTIPLRGTIYPGIWNFTLRGIWDGAQAKTDESQLLFHWTYLNEAMRRQWGAQADFVGVYVLGVSDPHQVAVISQRIDSQFRNSLAETLTETEAAFQL